MEELIITEEVLGGGFGRRRGYGSTVEDIIIAEEEIDIIEDIADGDW